MRTFIENNRYAIIGWTVIAFMVLPFIAVGYRYYLNVAYPILPV